VIVGTGGIGRELAQMLAPLGVGVLAVNRSGAALAGAERTVAVGALEGVLPAAHFVVLAAALTAETSGLMGAAMFGAMRNDAWLVNVARGGLVETDALVDALTNGRIAGAALDVTDPEPLPVGHPLWSIDDVIITPHIANTWEMALPELTALVGRNVGRFARGEPLEGVVDLEAGY
jgi:phosphoglycerate dehydrogenase-like enzyme